MMNSLHLVHEKVFLFIKKQSQTTAVSMAVKMLLGLSGKAGSGKDTVADYLVEKHGFVKMAFASVLKDGLKVLFNLTHEQLTVPELKETIDERWGWTPRQLMQWFGTDILREHVRQDFFIVHMKRLMKEHRNRDIVISDARFADECKSIWDAGGEIIRIERPGYLGTLSGSHSSEQLRIELNKHIINNGSKEDMYKEVDKLVSFYRKANQKLNVDT
jgi:hypothetical protein